MLFGNKKQNDGSNLIPFRDEQTDLYGFKNQNNQWVIEPTFKSTTYFNQGLALVCYNDTVNNLTNNWGYINPQGKWVIKPIYSFAMTFNQGLAAVEDGVSGDWGYINLKGKLVIDFTFPFAGSFSQGVAPAKDPLTYKWGYINTLKGAGLFNPHTPMLECLVKV